MTEYRQFTESEQRQIADICKRNKENLTPDEVDLIIAFETQQALQDAEFRATIERENKRVEQDMANRQIQHEQAVANMNAMHQAAMDRLQEVLNLVEKK